MKREEEILQLLTTTTDDLQLHAIAAKVLKEERLNVEEGIILFETTSLGFVGTLADFIR